MPRQDHEILIEEVLCKAKDKKPSRKSNTNCCLPDCNPDCCTPGYQRLDKLRMEWLMVQNSMFTIPEEFSVYNRAGQEVAVVGPTNVTLLPLEQTAYGFVNTVRYLNYEECGKLDQVTGWSIDVQTGNLYFYQNLPELGLSTADQRAVLLNTAPAALTPYDQRKLTEMEPFWKLSLKAIDRIRENPKTEGNICEIKDKCGKSFLVAINRTNSQPNASSVSEYNAQYSIVVVKLC
jgi:hypothetical protein